MEHRVTLTSDELMILDGKAGKEVQEEIRLVKQQREFQQQFAGITELQARFLCRVMRRVEEYKLLGFGRLGLDRCEVCGRSSVYPTYKSGPNKGKENHTKSPIHFGGVELAGRQFVSIRGWATLGCCEECWKAMKPLVAKVLEGKKAQLDPQITGRPNEWIRKDRMRCKSCGWEGHEGEMVPMPALMGGTYPGQCPKCGAKDLPLSMNDRNLERVNGQYDLVEAPLKVKS